MLSHNILASALFFFSAPKEKKIMLTSFSFSENPSVTVNGGPVLCTNTMLHKHENMKKSNKICCFPGKSVKAVPQLGENI